MNAHGLQFLRFIALGAVSAGVNFASRFAYSVVLPFEAAVAAAYLTGMAVAFVLFRAFVFPGSSKPLRAQVLAFVLVNLAGIAQVWTLSVLLDRVILPWAHYPGPREATAHALALAVPALTSFFGHKLLTFRRT